MLKTSVLVLLVGALTVVGLSCSSTQNPSNQCSSCADAKAKNGWCDRCSMGFNPDGTTTRCKMCHAGANGQTVWCDGCKKGYVNGKSSSCKGCVDAAKSGGNCPT